MVHDNARYDNIRPHAHAPAALGGARRLGSRGRQAREEAIVFLLATAEAAVVWLLSALVLGSEATPKGVPFAMVWVLVTAGALTPRLLAALDVWEPWYGAAVAAAVAATTAAAVKVAAFPDLAWFEAGWAAEATRDLTLTGGAARVPVWGIVAVSAYAWWRGRRRAEPTLDAAHRALRVGSAAVAAGVVVHGVGGAPLGDRAAIGATLAFFAPVLVGASLARGLDETREVGDYPARPRLRPTLGTPLGVGAVLAGALGIASLLSSEVAEGVLWVLAPLFWAVAVVLRAVVVVAAVVAFVLVAPVLWLLAGHQFGPVRVPRELQAPVAPERGIEEARRTLDVPEPIRYLAVLLVVSLLFSGVTRYTLRRRRRAAPDDGSRFAAEPTLAARLGGWGARLRAALGRPGTPADPLAGLRAERRWAHTVAVRKIYGRLLERSLVLGLPRAPGETAPRHAARLARGVALDTDGRDALADLTARYQAARYGPLPASAADAATAREAWRRLDRATQPDAITGARS